jgi:hypothetical protein
LVGCNVGHWLPEYTASYPWRLVRAQIEQGKEPSGSTERGQLSSLAEWLLALL